MNWINVKSNLINALKNNFTLTLILLIFTLWTNYEYENADNYFSNELGFIEIISIVVIVNLIYLNIKFRNILSKLSPKIFLNIRCLAFIFLLYEEASFITSGRLDVINEFNLQDEFNLHNIRFLAEYLIKDLVIPMTNFSISINYYYLIYLVFFLFIGTGSYVPLLNKFRILFLERYFSFYCLVYPLNILFTKLFRPSALFIHGELIELFFYIIFTLDTLLKVKLIKESKCSY